MARQRCSSTFLPSFCPKLAVWPVLQGPCVPKGLVRTFKVINVPGKDAKGKMQTGPLLSARLCDLDVLWQRAEQLCELSTQVRWCIAAHIWLL